MESPWPTENINYPVFFICIQNSSGVLAIFTQLNVIQRLYAALLGVTIEAEAGMTIYGQC